MKLKQDLPVVLFFGGSQGAQSINNAILGIIENRLNEKYQIVWAVGPGNYDEVKEKLRIKNIDIDNIENTKILPYIYSMQEVMEMSDLVVCMWNVCFCLCNRLLCGN